MNKLKKQQGFLILVALALILFIGLLGVAATYLFTTNTRAGADDYLSAQAFFLAQSGLEDATHELLAPTVASRSACSGLNLGTNTLGAGAYTVTSTGPTYVSSPTTITSASPLSAAATSIQVASTANYQSSGRIMIDQELINYTSTDATHFLNATRGVDGTTAATHVTGLFSAGGAAIGQYQCNLTARGGVPNLTTPTGTNAADPYGKRTLTEAVQLQEAWAVGAVSGTNYGIAHWNSPTETTWSNVPITAGARALNGISMISYVDGWAVGATGSGDFIHWNGSTWTPFTVTTVSAAAFNNVYCNASNDCHAVGNATGSVPALERWNGTTWSQIVAGSVLGSKGNNSLTSVKCFDSSNCWAVGNRATNNYFYHWDGAAWTGVNEGALAGNTFQGLACPGATDCWAVGNSATFSHYTGPAVGSAWAPVATGMPSAQYTSIFCNSTTDCWAVGPVNSSRDLIVHGTGSPMVWTRDLTAPTTSTNNLQSIKCVTPIDCWAVGVAKTFVHYNGSTWVNVTMPAAVPNVTYNSISIVGPNSRPQAVWQEN